MTPYLRAAGGRTHQQLISSVRPEPNFSNKKQNAVMPLEG